MSQLQPQQIATDLMGEWIKRSGGRLDTAVLKQYIVGAILQERHRCADWLMDKEGLHDVAHRMLRDRPGSLTWLQLQGMMTAAHVPDPTAIKL